MTPVPIHPIRVVEGLIVPFDEVIDDMEAGDERRRWLRRMRSNRSASGRLRRARRTGSMEEKSEWEFGVEAGSV
ncbi:hypothetical protein IEQ34_007127 [Dendrobium chrysotoxum]|uniref:Uncharacterized protein n=1 Tax=Dendrobium chrysotoxum TaxID=161865 RepID=A0AAV7H5H8_DENCH|nr:hypothetical protein IEQ34_007127 [Dendrobium chrysotoxum]